MKPFTLFQTNASHPARLRTLVKITVPTLLLLLPTAALMAAQQTTAVATAEPSLVEQLLQRVQELEAEVKELKAQQAKANPVAQTERAREAPQVEAPNSAPLKGGSTASPVQDTQPSTAATEAEVKAALEQERPEVPNGEPHLKIRGFADLGFRASDLKDDHTSFTLGQFDLFLSSRLSDKLSVLSDLVVEQSGNEFSVDVERLLLQYSRGDYLNVAAGRYLTAIGYYNATYQHGAWFQTTIGRPFIYKFDEQGGILPTHNVGMTANGLIPSGGLGLHYVAEVGNGKASRSEDAIQNFFDEKNRKAFNLGLYARPGRFPGLQTGFSVYHDRLIPDGQPKIGQTISAVYVVYVKPNFEFLNEGILIRQAPIGGTTIFNTPAFYTQVSRRFAGKYRPYFRYEYLNVPASDPVLSEFGRRNGPSAGIRIDVADYAAFKVEYDRTAQRGLSTTNGLALQLSFAF